MVSRLKLLQSQRVIHEKLAGNIIRSYPESTFAYDEWSFRAVSSYGGGTLSAHLHSP